MTYRTCCWLIALALAFVDAHAQGPASRRDHVDWHFSSLKQSGSEWKLVFTAVIDRGWHLYSQSTPANGPMPVSFTFEKLDAYRLSGKVKESGMVRRGYDKVFMTDVLWYEESVIFSQVLRVKSKGLVKGEINYSVCSEEMCIPGSVRFSLEVGIE